MAFFCDSMIGLGLRLTEAAREVGGLDALTQRLTGISRRTVSDWVSDKTEPRATSLAEICHITGVSIAWLVSGEGPKFGTQQFQQQTMIAELNMERLELALATIERGLEEAGKVASPAVKAQLTIAAYELLAESSERAVGSVLRLVKG